jgi:TPR repeat protein
LQVNGQAIPLEGDVAKKAPSVESIPKLALPSEDASDLIPYELLDNSYAGYISILHQSAEGGDIGAQYKIARLYADGILIKRDYSKAIKWCEDAADAGLAEAYTLLGVFSALGHGTPKNLDKALSYYKTAAELGDPYAAQNLGEIYYFGKGVVAEPVPWTQV